MNKHAKIPWRYEARKGHASKSRFVIISLEGERIAVCSESNENGKSNVEFIIRACNCHGEFLKLYEEISDSQNDLDYEIKQRLKLIIV